MSDLKTATDLAFRLHEGQTDRNGKPYILHVCRVSASGRNEFEKICGMLHDLVEDTDTSYTDLAALGFSAKIVKTVRSLTKKENETYDAFIQRLAKNKAAIPIKLNDLADNLDITRLKNISEADRKRLNKYLKAWHFLTDTDS